MLESLSLVAYNEGPTLSPGRGSTNDNLELEIITDNALVVPGTSVDHKDDAKQGSNWGDLGKHLHTFLEGEQQRRDVADVQDSLHNRVHKEWLFLSMVIDRIFFIVYVFAIAVALATIYPRP